MVRTTERQKTVTVETEEGKVFFMVEDVYHDGKFVKTHYSKQDGREYTDIGRQYMTYETEKAMMRAVKRLGGTVTVWVR